MTTYYDRTVTTHLDGTPIFKTEEDSRNENQVARQLEEAWRCTLHPFGKLAPVDWFAQRDGRIVGLVELKSRSHPSSRFDSVFLNVRKWFALQLGALGLGTPAIFVVQFTDGLRWVPVGEIDATKQRIGGTTRIVKAVSDIEPVIDVPIALMRVI